MIGVGLRMGRVMGDAGQLAAGQKPVIGLLGGPGAGKSAVARAFAEQGCGVIDADALAAAILAQPQSVAAVRQWWGESVVGPDGRPDREVIASIVFEDPAQLGLLEGLLHPRVHAERERLRDRMFADRSVVAVVEDCPLLIESGIATGCDALVFVDAPFEQRLARVRRTRGWDRSELQRRQDRQLSLDTKRSRADHVIDSRDGADLRSQSRILLNEILHKHNQSSRPIGRLPSNG